MASKQRIRFAFVLALTLGRVPLVLAFLAICLAIDTRAHPAWFIVAFACMLASVLTDLFDGYYARKFGVVTRLGGLFDPLVDKMFFIVTLPALVYRACLAGRPLLECKLLLAAVVLLMGRDLWVTFLREISSGYKIDSKAMWVGKLRTIFLFVAICTTYWYLQAPTSWWLQPPALIVYALWIACLYMNFHSMWVYTLRYKPCLADYFRRDVP